MSTGVQVDPTLTRADRLVGQVLGEVDALPDVFTELEINFFLLRRLLGVRTQVGSTYTSLWHLLNVCYCNSRCACMCKGCWQVVSYWRYNMQGGEKQGKVQKLSKGEVLMLNIGSMCTGARVIAVSPSSCFCCFHRVLDCEYKPMTSAASMFWHQSACIAYNLAGNRLSKQYAGCLGNIRLCTPGCPWRYMTVI